MGVYPVIMCGGAGTRLWPASRPSRPKQFLSLTGPDSIFVQTVRRARGVSGFAGLVVVAGRAHGDAVSAELNKAGTPATVLLEPEPRDSAPAMAAAAAWIEAHDPEGIAIFLASDHHIPDTQAFQSALNKAVAAARTGTIVTLGIKPTYPATQFGYIRPGESMGETRRVAAFVEKPDNETAKRFIADGYLWNGGNFVAAAKTLLGELQRYAPDIVRCARDAVSTASQDLDALQLGPRFREAPKISIDYAVMEKTDRATVLPLNLAWSDLGAWDAIWAASDKQAGTNVGGANVHFVEAENCLVHGGGDKLIALVGTHDLSVVVEDDAILVCQSTAAQSVKKIVEKLRATASPHVDVPAAASLHDEAKDLKRWLFTSALPLWWAVGTDLEGWGFFESIALDGRAIEANRRARVQARQVYVFATAGKMGWSGPWRTAVAHGVEALTRRYRRSDGLYRSVVAPDGKPVDEAATLYNQAFVLLALASARGTIADTEAQAQSLLDAIGENLRHDKGGFRENGKLAFQSNPHMHLLEAALAWQDAGGDARWANVASEIVDLALTHFIDRDGGFLREHFDASWKPAPGDDGRIVEPGHQFEWAWLLKRWAAKSGDARASVAAARLFQAGLKGIDASRGVAIDSLNDDFSVRSATARLWPQTERIKATIACSDAFADWQPRARSAVRGLKRYFATEIPGLWRDKLRPDGTFVDEPAPASSLYHIVCAIEQLQSIA